MTRRRHTPDQIIRKLAEGHKRLAGGAELDEVVRQLEIAESTWHRWVAQYGGMKASDAKRLKELEAENARLKKLLAEAELDKSMLKELAAETSDPEPPTPRRRDAGGALRGLGTKGVPSGRPTPLHPAPHPAHPDEEEQRLREWLRAFSTQRPRWGWRRAAKAARREGWVVNDKRVQRLWRDDGLKVPYRKRKKPHRGIGTAIGAMCPIVPDALWAMDFQFDTTVDGRTLKLLNLVDEFTRECPVIVVDRSIDADKVVATLDRLALKRGAPAFVRFDNGPEFIAAAVADWCRFNGVGTVFIDPGSPWQNAWTESFNGRLRDEVPQRLAVRQPARSPGAHRGMEDRLQRAPTPQCPRGAHAQ